MNEPHFTNRADALTQAEHEFLPAGMDWNTNILKEEWDAYRQVLYRVGALPSTMHFGMLELDLINNEVRFIDQDHRDGYDSVIHRAPLPPAWVTRLRTITLWDR